MIFVMFFGNASKMTQIPATSHHNAQTPEIAGPASEEAQAQIARVILSLLDARDGKSICPSDVARTISSVEATWRALMPEVRRVAWQLATQGKVLVTQGQRILESEPSAWRGPVRIRRIEDRAPDAACDHPGLYD